ncbi:hypothetical protein D3C75_1322430 [compost metagenome]
MVQQVRKTSILGAMLFQLELGIHLQQALNQQQDQQGTEGCDGIRNTFDHLY